MAQTKVSLIKDQVIDLSHLKPEHGITTDHIGEGSTRQYFTESRVQNILTTNNYITTSDVPNLETVTSLSINANVLSYTNEAGVTTNIDLSVYLDDTNLARIVSGSLNSGTGVAMFTRDDSSTFTVDFSAFLSDANDYVTSASFNTTSGVLTLTRLGGGTVTVDLDGKYSVLGHTHSWTEITDKPTTFAPSSHNHDDRYYTETEVNTFLTNKSNWDTAYGWGNHAGLYLPIGGKAADSNLLDGIDSSNFFRTDGTYPNTDMNDTVEGYWHVASGSANLPVDSYGHRWDYDHIQNGQWVFQMYSPTGGDVDLWFRQKRNSTATAWQKVITSGNIGSQSVSYASTSGNASSLQGRVVGSSTDNVAFLGSTRNLVINNPEAYTGEVRLGAAWDYGGVYASSTLTMASSSDINFVIGNNVYANLTTDYFSHNGKILMGTFPQSTTNSGAAWIGRAADRALGTMTVQLGGDANRTFEVVDHAWSVVTFKVNGSGTASASESFRAPIFYDSNNTGYYVDPTNNSSIYQAISFGDSSRYSAVSTTINGSGAGDKLILYGNVSNYDARVLVGTDYDFIFKSQGSPSNKGMFRFYSGNNATLAMEIGADQVVSAPNSSMRSPIFYDSNNTSYYTNPAGTSYLYDLDMPHLDNGTENIRANIGGQENWRAIALSGGSQDNVGWGIHGTSRSIFGRSGTSIHFPDDGSFRLHTNGWDTEFEVEGGGEAWLKGSLRASRLYDNNNTTYYVDPASTSVIRKTNLVASGSGWEDGLNLFSSDATNKWNLLVDQGASNAFRIAYNSSERLNFETGGAITATGSLRAPIFYDSNNTAYYINPDNENGFAANLRGDIYTTNGKIYVKRGTGWTTTGWLDDSTDNGRAQLVLDSHYSDLIIASRNDNTNRHGSTLTFATQSTSTGDYAKWVIGQGQYQEGADHLSFAYGVNQTNPHDVLGTDNANYDFQIHNGGTTYSSGSSRAPIFYDSNNTGYFLNPDTTSVSLKIKGGIVTDAPSGSTLLHHQVSEANAWLFRENAANWGLYWFNMGGESGQTFGSYTTVGAEFLGFRQGTTANSINPNAWTGIDTSANATWMLSNFSGDFWSAGTQYSATDMRAPIFYDSGNTGYYLNLDATSNIGGLEISGSAHKYLYITPGNGYEAMVRFNGGSGSTWYVGSRTSTQLVGSTDAWHVYSQTAGRTVSGTDTAGNTFAFGSSRAPIFYDLNDTTYYVDPASGSYLAGSNSINVARETGVGLKIQGGSNGGHALVLNGGGFSTAAEIFFPSSASGMSIINNGFSGQNAIAFRFGSGSGNYVGGILINTSSTTYATSSDYRLKENIVPMTGSLDRLMLLKPSRFNFIGDEKVVDGFIAHEAQEVVPEAVTGEKDAIGWDGNPEYQGIDQSKLVPLLTAALQEAVAKIESLESRIQALEEQ